MARPTRAHSSEVRQPTGGRRAGSRRERANESEFENRTWRLRRPREHTTCRRRTTRDGQDRQANGRRRWTPTRLCQYPPRAFSADRVTGRTLPPTACKFVQPGRGFEGTATSRDQLLLLTMLVNALSLACAPSPIAVSLPAFAPFKRNSLARCLSCACPRSRGVELERKLCVVE